MFLTTETQRIFYLLSNDSRLQDTVIRMAYPFEYTPTKPQHNCICISPSRTEMDACAIGESAFNGTFEIMLDVFVPQRCGSPVLQEVLETALCVLRNTGIGKIQIGSICSLDEQNCFTVSCALTYASAFYLTEDRIWTQMRENG